MSTGNSVKKAAFAILPHEAEERAAFPHIAADGVRNGENNEAGACGIADNPQQRTKYRRDRQIIIVSFNKNRQCSAELRREKPRDCAAKTGENRSIRAKSVGLFSISVGEDGNSSKCTTISNIQQSIY